ncbi:hypothetical protein TNCV_1236551 [Trichonephila clavipes]|nr:hypothetical protein TNCV_1236551 [Trichonephila clavipes]
MVKSYRFARYLQHFNKLQAEFNRQTALLVESSLRDAEIILRAGQRIISEINILVENSQGSSQIPKSNPQLLNAEIKKKIARHENIKLCLLLVMERKGSLR